MGERYWISGVQIGMLLAFLKTNEPLKANEILDGIQEKQFIGNTKDLQAKTE